jgi:DNA gyrase subunit A
VMTVSDGDEIMAVTKKGMVVRSSPSEIRETGRSAVGVRLISMESGDKLSSIAHVVSHEEE